MTLRTDIPEALVRKRYDELVLASQAQGRRPSVLTLARQLGMSNTTLRRNFPDIAREIADLRRQTDPASISGPSAHDKLTARNAKIRRRNHELSAQLKLAIAQIQYLALENTRLREALEGQAKVTSLAERRLRS